jgi:hypothetical protein
LNKKQKIKELNGYPLRLPTFNNFPSKKYRDDIDIKTQITVFSIMQLCNFEKFICYHHLISISKNMQCHWWWFEKFNKTSVVEFSVQSYQKKFNRSCSTTVWTVESVLRLFHLGALQGSGALIYRLFGAALHCTKLWANRPWTEMRNIGALQCRAAPDSL